MAIETSDASQVIHASFRLVVASPVYSFRVAAQQQCHFPSRDFCTLPIKLAFFFPFFRLPPGRSFALGSRAGPALLKRGWRRGRGGAAVLTIYYPRILPALFPANLIVMAIIAGISLGEQS
jgi:hypothetical protein